MKKTAIVSCYFQHNYGSMLQAYATQMVLDKLGYDNETINISGLNHEIKRSKYIYFAKAALTSDFLLSKIGMIKNVLMKKLMKNEYSSCAELRNRRFDEFSRKYFRLSEEYGSKKVLGKICRDRYATVLVGSDQLWLPGNIAADYYTLNFVPEDVNTIAYATSFGQAQLPSDSRKKAAIFLRKINHIGVREESGQRLVEEIAGRRVPLVCDPTLLFTGKEWLALIRKEAIIRDSYIFCYFLGNNPQHRKYAERLKERTGCKIVALVHLDEYVRADEDFADITPYDIDPFDFLNLVHYAAYVCTDSFHCTVFSLLFQKNFFVFRRYGKKTRQSTNNRLDTLLKSAGVSDRMLIGDEDVEDHMNSRIDYEAVNQKIDEARRYSLEFLTDAMENKVSTDLA